jgi:hypothetical protein
MKRSITNQHRKITLQDTGARSSVSFPGEFLPNFRPEKYDINLKQVSYQTEFFRSKFGENEAFFHGKMSKIRQFF